MTTAAQQKTGGGFFSKLVIVVLLAVAIGLYLQIVMMDGERQASQNSAPQVSVPIVESDAPTPLKQVFKPLPEEQQALIMRVFAPELGAASGAD